MTKALRNSLYLGASALMLASLGAPAVSGIQANAKARRAPITRISRHYYGHSAYHVTSRWSRSHAYKYILNGKFYLTNKPSIYSSARTVLSKYDQAGLKVAAPKGEMINGQKFYQVITKNGLTGWIHAAGVSRYKVTPKKSHPRHHVVISSVDRKNVSAAKTDALKADFSAEFINNGLSAHDSNLAANKATNYLNRTIHNVEKIQNKKMRDQTAEQLLPISNYVRKATHGVNVQANENAVKLNNNLSSADNYLIEASKKGVNSKLCLRLAQLALGNAKAENQNVANSAVQNKNNQLIAQLSNAYNQMSKHRNNPVLPHQAKDNIQNDIQQYRHAANHLISEAKVVMRSGHHAVQAQSLMNTAHEYLDLANKLAGTPTKPSNGSASSNKKLPSLKGMTHQQAENTVRKFQGHLTKTQLMNMINSYFD